VKKKRVLLLKHPESKHPKEFVGLCCGLLDKEEIKSIWSISLFLCYHLFSFTETKAVEYTAVMVKKSERTVLRWRTGLIDNNGVLLNRSRDVTNEVTYCGRMRN
jgi:hypothetical protein